MELFIAQKAGINLIKSNQSRNELEVNRQPTRQPADRALRDFSNTISLAFSQYTLIALSLALFTHKGIV